MILTRVSDEYETELPLNVDYLYEQTVAYFEERLRWSRLVGQVGSGFKVYSGC
jgi:hypothetical protein